MDKVILLRGGRGVGEVFTGEDCMEKETDTWAGK